jgi:putative membrane protein
MKPGLSKDFFNPYAKFSHSSLTLNDYLAIDRTILANERTLLAYGRTALAQVIVGGGAVKLFSSPLLTLLGGAFLTGGVATMLIGWHRYRHTDRLLQAALLSQIGEAKHPLEQKLAESDEQQKQESKPAASSDSRKPASPQS